MFKRLWKVFLTTASLPGFTRVYGAWVPYLLWFGALCFLLGSAWGLFVAPPDYLQGNSYRIIYLHVPAASLALSSYLLIATASAVFLVWNIKAAHYLAYAMIPVGLCFAVISLLTGSIWGKPTWGTYWEWDARLTSMLLLAFLYVGLWVMHAAFQGTAVQGKAAAMLAVVGVVMLPIIRYSVVWWNTLHQGQTLRVFGTSSIEPSMLWPLMLCLVGAYVFTMGLGIYRAVTHMLEADASKAWAQQWLKNGRSL